jgi:iduronate 2-sulfatase
MACMVLLLSACPVLFAGAPPPSIPQPGGSSKQTTQARSPSPHLLYILVDDLRPELGAYGAASSAAARSSGSLTPHLDQLASESLVFERAFCQQAVCGPSRNSFLSGRRPDVTRTWTFRNSFRDVGPEWTSMLGYLLRHGYSTAGQGKIYHPHSPPDDDGNRSWSPKFLPYPEWTQRGDPCPGDGRAIDPVTELPYATTTASAAGLAGLEGDGLRRQLDEGNPVPSDPSNGPACPMPDDFNATDMQIADLALQNMGTLAKAGNPFVLAVGFHKPHLPWTVPEKYYKMAPALGDIPLAVHQTSPISMPPVAFWACSESELSGFSNVDIRPQAPLNASLARHWRQGYYAAVAFTDAQIGRVLDGLATHGLEQETLTIFHADHGWQLGEHAEWCKQTLFELATRVPMMIRLPGGRGVASRGKRTRALVELVTTRGACRPTWAYRLRGIHMIHALQS